jgi:hypothetical protein
MPVVCLCVWVARYLLATLCFVEANVEVARAAGCLRAVLSCFSRHSGVKEVYDNFREVRWRGGACAGLYPWLCMQPVHQC